MDTEQPQGGAAESVEFVRTETGDSEVHEELEAAAECAAVSSGGLDLGKVAMPDLEVQLEDADRIPEEEDQETAEAGSAQPDPGLD